MPAHTNSHSKSTWKPWGEFKPLCCLPCTLWGSGGCQGHGAVHLRVRAVLREGPTCSLPLSKSHRTACLFVMAGEPGCPQEKPWRLPCKTLWNPLLPSQDCKCFYQKGDGKLWPCPTTVQGRWLEDAPPGDIQWAKCNWWAETARWRLTDGIIVEKKS